MYNENPREDTKKNWGKKEYNCILDKLKEERNWYHLKCLMKI